jgi:hypothetical protein
MRRLCLRCGADLPPPSGLGRPAPPASTPKRSRFRSGAACSSAQAQASATEPVTVITSWPVGAAVITGSGSAFVAKPGTYPPCKLDYEEKLDRCGRSD